MNLELNWQENEETIRPLNLVCDGVEIPTEEEEQEILNWQEDNQLERWAEDQS